MAMVVAALIVSTGAQAAPSPGVDTRAVAAIFSQYETVFFYTNTDLSSAFSSFKGLSRQTAGSLIIPFGDLISGLDSLDTHVSADMLAKSKAVLMGGKGFIPPEGVGGTEVSRFCYIVQFGRWGRPDFQKYAAKAQKSSAAGELVWSWQVQAPGPRGQNVTDFAAQVGDSYFVLSNDLGELEVIAKKLASWDDASKTLSGIHDWAVLSQHEYWGYGRPNGPAMKGAVGLDDLFPGADALTFYCDVKQKTGVLRLFGAKGEDGATPRTTGRAGMYLSLLTFKASGAAVWEAAFPLSGEKAWERVFSVVGLLGFENMI